MVFPMKTTFDINDDVVRRLREEAARRGTTMSALVEAGLRRVLAEPAPLNRRKAALPSLVNISDRDQLYRAMDGY